MRAFRHWRWQLDEMYMKLNSEIAYLWRAVDHKCEVLESSVTKSRGQGGGTYLREEVNETVRLALGNNHRWFAQLPRWDQ